MREKVVVVGIVSDPRICGDICAAGFQEEAVATFQVRDAVPKPDGRCDLPVHAALTDSEVYNWRLPPFDICAVHVSRDTGDCI